MFKSKKKRTKLRGKGRLVCSGRGRMCSRARKSIRGGGKKKISM